MPRVVTHLLWYLQVFSTQSTENCFDGPRVGGRPSKIPPSLLVSSILMGFSGTSHLNSFQGSWVAIYPGWVGTRTTLSVKGWGIKSSVISSRDLAGKVTQLVLEILPLTVAQGLADQRILAPCSVLVRQRDITGSFPHSEFQGCWQVRGAGAGDLLFIYSHSYDFKAVVFLILKASKLAEELVENADSWASLLGVLRQ